MYSQNLDVKLKQKYILRKTVVKLVWDFWRLFLLFQPEIYLFESCSLKDFICFSMQQTINAYMKTLKTELISLGPIKQATLFSIHELLLRTPSAKLI